MSASLACSRMPSNSLIPWRKERNEKEPNWRKRLNWTSRITCQKVSLVPPFFSPSVWSSFFFFTKQKLTIVHSLKSWMKKKKHAGWTIGTNAFSFWLWWISDNVQTPILFSTFRHDRCFVLHLQRMKSLLKKKSLPSWPDPVPDRGCWPWTAGSASASGSRSDGSWVFRARPHQGKQQAGYYLLKGEVRRWA